VVVRKTGRHANNLTPLKKLHLVKWYLIQLVADIGGSVAFFFDRVTNTPWRKVLTVTRLKQGAIFENHSLAQKVRATKRQELGDNCATNRVTSPSTCRDATLPSQRQLNNIYFNSKKERRLL
jgi:hypothetical protein